MADKPAATETKPTETKRQRFVRLATTRVDKALKATLLIANLTGPAYEYTDADIDAIGGALRAAQKRVDEAFRAKSAPATEGFKLPTA